MGILSPHLLPHRASALAALCLLLASPVPAQKSAVRFERLASQQSLSQSTVNAIVQDPQGFLWFGTQDGLNRYDGQSFRLYKNIAGDTTSLSDNAIWSLLRSRSGDLWVGTRHGGVNRYLVSRDAFEHLRHDPSDASSLSDDNVSAIFEDSRGTLWVGTLGNGLNRLDPGSAGFIRYRHDPSDSTSLSGNIVWSIVEDLDGTIWVGTWNGLSEFLPAAGQPGRFRRHMSDPKDPRTISHNNIRTLLVDRRGVLWVGTWGGGLNRFDQKTRTFSRYLHATGVPWSIGSNQVLSLFEDSKNVFWVGTGDRGLDILNRESGVFSHYRPDPADPTSLSNETVCSIYEDAAGSVWVGTGAGGVNHFDRVKIKFSLYRDDPDDPADMQGNDVWAIMEDLAGELWVGTYGTGLNRFDRKRNLWKHYGSGPPLTSNRILALCESRDGDVWIGTEGGGLNRFDRATETFTAYRHRSGDRGSLIQDEVTAIREDRQGILWIGTNGSGLERFDPARGVFEHFPPRLQDSGALASGAIMSLYLDRRGDLWVGAGDGGVHRYDSRTGRFTRYGYSAQPGKGLNNNTVLSICEDQSGDLWFGTFGGGLNRLAPSTGRFEYVTEAEGLPNNVVYAILPDWKGSLWLTTNRGIALFNPEDRRFRVYDVTDGLQGNEFNQGSACRLRSGEIAVGGINGFNLFHPDSLRDNLYVPPVYLTSFQLFGKAFNPGLPLTVLDELELSYSQNFFSFEYVALNFVAPEKNTYAYKLEGLDPEWVMAGTRRFASYTNVDPGSYVLRVKGSNNDGIWNEEGVRIRVTVTPPFWKTWWFMLLVVVSLGAIGAALYRYRVNKLLEIERIRTSIATDLHDDIGSTLTEMALISDVGVRTLRTEGGAVPPPDTEKVATVLKEIGTTSRGLIDAMNDIVWAVNPEKDSFEFLLLRMKTHATRMLEAKGIDYQIDIPAELSHLQMSLVVRRRLFLIFKEALNNALRHARPTMVTLAVRREGKTLIMKLTDNGLGFDPSSGFLGNGLRNMQQRAASVGGELQIASAPGAGTTITLRSPIR